MSTCNDDNLCAICRESFIYYGYSACNHPFCSKCIIKLRMFESRVKDLDLSSCPTCRTKFQKILVVKEFVPFENVDFGHLKSIPDYDLYFGDDSAFKHYESLIACVCPECGDICATLSALNRHCSQKHFKMYCDLCIRQARLLPHEFPLFTRPQLIEHRKWDKNKGHPPCDFCDTRYYDFDDLVAHVREKHFYCDLCLRMRLHIFFKSQRDLMDHYSGEHFMCQDCFQLEKTNVFMSDIDLKAHRVRDHASGRQKAELREEATIPMQIRYNTPAAGTNASSASSDRRYRGQGRGGRGSEEEEILVFPPKIPEYEATPEDFPTLGGNQSMPRNASWNGNISTMSGKMKQEDFPSLSSATTKPVVGGAWTNKNKTSKSSASVAPKPQFSSARSSPNIDADYPSLSGSTSPRISKPNTATPNHNASTYSCLLSENSSAAQTNRVPLRRPNFSNANDERDDFPSLPAAAAPPATVGWMLKAPVNTSPNKFSAAVNQSLLSSNQPSTKTKKKKTKSKSTVKKVPEQSHGPINSNSRAGSSSFNNNRGPDTAWQTVKNGARIESESDTESESEEEFPALNSAHGQYGNQFQTLQSVESSFVPVNLVSFTDNSQSKPSKQTPKLTKDDFPSLMPAKKSNVQPAHSAAKQEKQQKSVPPPQNKQHKSGGNAFTLRDLASSLQNFVYHSPPEFDQRNFDLINQMQTSLSPDQFNDFASIAGSYRQRTLDAQSFLKGCRTLMSADLQMHCLPEMLVLLPDIGLQKSFFAVIPNSWREMLRECYLCGQICRVAEITGHMSAAHPDN